MGLRDTGYAVEFMRDVAGRLKNRVQLTSDGHSAYLIAVASAFGGSIDYSMLQKLYGQEPGIPKGRYSPAQCIAVRATPMTGNPDARHISTSFVERQNLSLRMENRRFTRLTVSFSKRWINHEHAIALHYFHYNFIRRHKTLGTTPAVAAGVAEKVWTIADLVELLEDEERKLAKGGRINREDRS